LSGVSEWAEKEAQGLSRKGSAQSPPRSQTPFGNAHVPAASLPRLQRRKPPAQTLRNTEHVQGSAQSHPRSQTPFGNAHVPATSLPRPQRRKPPAQTLRDPERRRTKKPLSSPATAEPESKDPPPISIKSTKTRRPTSREAPPTAFINTRQKNHAHRENDPGREANAPSPGHAGPSTPARPTAAIKPPPRSPPLRMTERF